MNSNLANRIYDILVQEADAMESQRDNFIRHHTGKENCYEWRFCGSLGFGGKFRSERMTVDCYPEDSTKEREKIITRTNDRLNEVAGQGQLCLHGKVVE